MFENKEALMEAGLGEKEAKVYLSLLSIGSATVSDIAKRADIIRTTVYDVLDRLINRGIVSQVIREGVKYFEAADPDEILKILDEKRSKFKEALPELQSLQRSTVEKPVIETYERKEGLKNILEDMLKEGEDICGFSSMKLLELLEYYFPSFIERRAEKGIKSRVIMEKSEETQDLKEKGEEELREVRFIEEAEEFRLGHYIYGDKIAILLAEEREPVGILIEDENFAKEEKLIFERMWSIAEE